MKTNLLYLMALSVGLSLLTPALRAEDQPKPGPEQEKLEAWVGTWTYTGSSEATPFGPASKYSGKLTGRMVLNGFFLEVQWEEKDEQGAIGQGINFQGYDPVTKSYTDTFFNSHGSSGTGTTVIDGNTWTATGTNKDPQGRVYKTKLVIVFSPDRKSLTEIAQYSADDGKIWLPWYKDVTKKVSGSAEFVDSIIGTWKLNVAKSTFSKAMQDSPPKESTEVIREIEGGRLELFANGVEQDGSKGVFRITFPAQGGLVTVIADSAAEETKGLTFIETRLSSGNWFVTTLRDGKQVFLRHKVVSADGNTKRETVQGTDDNGRRFEQIEVFERIAP
ncbi:MAG: DUF1579 family protein [Verrucomicrobiia bacterium]